MQESKAPRASRELGAPVGCSNESGKRRKWAETGEIESFADKEPAPKLASVLLR